MSNWCEYFLVVTNFHESQHIAMTYQPNEQGVSNSSDFENSAEEFYKNETYHLSFHYYGVTSAYLIPIKL